MTTDPRIPLDIVPLILEQLGDRRELHTCATLSRAFHQAAIPLLYRTLDSRTIDQFDKHGMKLRPRVLHPAQTLLEKKNYAKYVRHVSETSAVAIKQPELISKSCRALHLCTHLVSFSWTDDVPNASHEHVLLDFLDVLEGLSVKELVIHTRSGLSDHVWERLTQFTGLRKVALWCLDGKPRIMQGWSERLGDSLTALEIGRCAGVPASILVSVLSYLPALRELRLKGAQGTAILEILTFLPHLESLDTEFIGPALSRYDDEPLGSLRELTVRTSSIDVQGPQHLWPWIRKLLPRPSLESFTLHAFSTSGSADIPRAFLLELAQTHGNTLKHFNVTTAQLTINDVKCLCTVFPALENLSCAIPGYAMPEFVKDALAPARKLREVRMSTNWGISTRMDNKLPSDFGVEDARGMMEESDCLRLIGIGRTLYLGRWVLTTRVDDERHMGRELVFEVVPSKW